MNACYIHAVRSGVVVILRSTQKLSTLVRRILIQTLKMARNPVQARFCGSVALQDFRLRFTTGLVLLRSLGLDVPYSMAFVLSESSPGLAHVWLVVHTLLAGLGITSRFPLDNLG
uniref:Uncharacterized protein n=2 Tax=Timema TaxID=61471 RepID=A0A7R9CX71_TIMPO|nr:unnamed protein product [Timema douglasi]CAD7404119.1 unnamed protein product [Timema poppensis]